MLKTTHSFSLLLPILITFSLAIQFIPGTASAEVYKTDSFTLSLPLGWSLTKGPVKKDGGEMAVFGRNDRKAAFIIISGPFEPGNFKALAEKCAQQPGMEKISETENQAMLKIANNGHDEYTLLRQDETQTHLFQWQSVDYGATTARVRGECICYLSRSLLTSTASIFGLLPLGSECLSS